MAGLHVRPAAQPEDDRQQEEFMPKIDLQTINHIGIRVRDFERSVEFYRHLGFEKVWYSPQHRVGGLRNAAGIELNLIVNSDDANDGKNILMDMPARYPGYTHASFRVASVHETVGILKEKGIAITEGPIDLGGEIAVFIRDPDQNVLEVAEITPPK
jgi:catechol 2,3-dioxygenase-like lactoylglutathione lyase family enzyme